MFDVGFSELLVIAVVALLVLGPERLPKAARFAGLWVRRARSHWNSVKAEFENELAAEDLQRTLRETREALASAEAQLRGGASALQAQLDEAQGHLRETQAHLQDTVQQATRPLSAPTAPVAADAHAVTPSADAHALPLPDAPEHVPESEHAHPEMFRSQVDHSLLEPPPPADEDDEGTPAVPPPDAPPALTPSPPTEPGAHRDAGR
jgi:sec-independent protein translocase protein TatB